jgi:hypothetical protein
MKRSKMVDIMGTFLWKMDQSVNPDPKWWDKVSNLLLKEIENAGMLPPRTEVSIGIPGREMFKFSDNCWDKENE